MSQATNTSTGQIRGDVDPEAIAESLPEGTNYLFAIAVDNYEKHANFINLSNPVRDADSVIKTLLKKFTFKNPDQNGMLANRTLDGQSVSEYRDDEVYCLYNENATWNNIEDHLIKLYTVLVL